MSRSRLSVASGVLAVLAAVAFFAVGQRREDAAPPPARLDTLRVLLGDPTYVRTRRLADSLVAVQRYAVTAPLSDHRPLADRLGPP